MGILTLPYISEIYFQISIKIMSKRLKKQGVKNVYNHIPLLNSALCNEIKPTARHMGMGMAT